VLPDIVIAADAGIVVDPEPAATGGVTMERADCKAIGPIAPP
jgi:hypothetical protein